MQCVDTLSTSSNSGVFTESRDLQHLQTAVSFLTTSVGRDAIIKTLSQGNFILPLLNSVWPPESESEPDEDQQQQQQRLSSELEVRRGYAIEIVDFFLRSNDSVEFLRKVYILHIYTMQLSEINNGNISKCLNLAWSENPAVYEYIE